MSIKDLTDEELQKELKRRAEERRQKSIPKPLDKPDFSEVIKMAEEVIQDTLGGLEEIDEDTVNYFYEECMRAVYGQNIFDWLNKMQEENEER